MTEKKNKSQEETIEEKKVQNESKVEEQEQAQTKEDKKEEKAEEKSSSKKKKSKSSSDKKKSELEEMGYKLAEINDKYMRLSAEFDNYRKRTLKEKSDILKTAGGTVLADMLPVVDDFERAMEQMEKAEDMQAVVDGITLIYSKFKEFMKNKGLTEIEAMNEEFDTDYHEALTKIPAPSEDMKGKVVDVLQKGYIIDEKVIRFAKVVIGE